MIKVTKEKRNTTRRFNAAEEEQKFLLDGFNRLSDMGKMTLLDILCAFLHDQRTGREHRDVTQ